MSYMQEHLRVAVIALGSDGDGCKAIEADDADGVVRYGHVAVIVFVEVEVAIAVFVDILLGVDGNIL